MTMTKIERAERIRASLTKSRTIAFGLVGLYTAFGVLLLASEPARAYDMRNNQGGEVEKFEALAQRLTKTQEQVVFGGECNSACNVLFMKRYHINACKSGPLTLGFHMPALGTWADAAQTHVVIDTGPENVAFSKRAWREEWLGKFPKRLNDILVKATQAGRIPNPSVAGDTSRLYRVPVTDAIPDCKE